MRLMHRVITCLGFVSIWLLSAGAAALPVTLEIEPSSADLRLNESIELAVAIDGLEGGLTDPDGPSLGAYDLHLSWDPSVFGLHALVFGAPVLGNQLDISGFGSVSATDAGFGTVNAIEVSLDSVSDLLASQASAFTLFTIELVANGLGSSQIEISDWLLSDESGVELEPLGVTGANVRVLQNPVVPEPALWLMMITGLLALQGIRAGRVRGSAQTSGLRMTDS